MMFPSYVIGKMSPVVMKKSKFKATIEVKYECRGKDDWSLFSYSYHRQKFVFFLEMISQQIQKSCGYLCWFINPLVLNDFWRGKVTIAFITFEVSIPEKECGTYIPAQIRLYLLLGLSQQNCPLLYPFV